MTSTLSPVTIAAIRQNAYDTISASIGLIAILLLVMVLVVKEIVRARDGESSAVAAFDVAVVPLVLVAGVIMGLRIVSLL